MKKLILFTAIVLGLFAAANTEAQVSVRINISSQPVWGPVGFDYAEYYYIPEIEAYYYVPRHKFICFEGNRWVSYSKLPPRYHDIDLYRVEKVVINEPKPYLHCGTGTALSDLFDTCDAACAANNNAELMNACSAQLDCYNNGGQWINGKCALGTCSATGAFCGDRFPCPVDVDPTNTCEAFPNNCHDQPLDGGAVPLPEPPHNAEPQVCQAATKSTNTIFTAGVCPQ